MNEDLELRTEKARARIVDSLAGAVGKRLEQQRAFNEGTAESMPEESSAT